MATSITREDILPGREDVLADLAGYCLGGEHAVACVCRNHPVLSIDLVQRLNRRHLATRMLAAGPGSQRHTTT